MRLTRRRIRSVLPLQLTQSCIYSACQNHSADSLASDNLSDDDAHTEDAHHVTQMHQIVGRQNTLSRAVGGLIPRRLSRARSASVVAQDNSTMVIGVSVVEATTEHALGDAPSVPSTVVHTLRTQRSTSSLSRTDSLLDRALGLTKKLRRKSKISSSTPSPS